ncbi:Sulfate permease family [Fragilaria crotonensis]|nr:Sulfate permease family [Fragilaria crotonensis]
MWEEELDHDSQNDNDKDSLENGSMSSAECDKHFEVMSSPSVMEPPSGRTSDSLRRASAVLLDLGEKRSRRSIVDVRNTFELHPLLRQLSSSQSHAYETIPEDGEHSSFGELSTIHETWTPHKNYLLRALGQIPAILLACLLNLMVGIPFGVSYFPIEWSSTNDNSDDNDTSTGTFPLPNRVALGIRMFLFSTIVGQLAFTFKSKFTNPISLQMVENVPFFHALAHIVVQEQGYGIEALSTLFFIFGMSTLLVAAVFFTLGKLKYGRIVYFFPSHVLVGCIGGIGVFIVVTAMEVTLNASFTFSIDGFRTVYDHFNRLGVVLAFEVVLRILDYLTHDEQGRPRFPLLAPIYFCLITPLFYIGLKVCGISLEDADKAGYLFPSLADGDADTGIFNMDVLAIFRVVDVTTISWTAVVQSIPTMVALAAFSLIHVPINIPAFGISTDVDTDMNAELLAHGWSNALSGLFGGLQNYMTYSNSVMYAKSGGSGKISSLVVAFLTCVLFVVGPEVVNYIPRCMAGTLLLHIGIDLFLEGVWDSYGNYDRIEYLFIWVITLVMTTHGMTAALIAGIIAAMSTYAAQSIANANPIRGTMNASTLRSSAWNRSSKAMDILDDPHRGRSRILILKLQGHLFFGNVAQITDQMKMILHENKGTDKEAWIVIMDFTLVVGMDSSAAHAIAKLKNVMHKAFRVEVSIFVTGSGHGFPCEYALSQELSKASEESANNVVDWNDLQQSGRCIDNGDGTHMARGAVSVSMGSAALNATFVVAKYPKEHVCENLDTALIFAEDILVARADPMLQQLDQAARMDGTFDRLDVLSLDEEMKYALKILNNLCPNANAGDIEELLTFFQREEYKLHDVVWEQGDASNSAKLLVCGTLMSYLEGTDTTESVQHGNMLGELGLVHGTPRFSKVVCHTEKAILYSISREAWNDIVSRQPRLARLVDGIVIRYLAHRVQHVSNRIFETRCLPV